MGRVVVGALATTVVVGGVVGAVVGVAGVGAGGVVVVGVVGVVGVVVVGRLGADPPPCLPADRCRLPAGWRAGVVWRRPGAVLAVPGRSAAAPWPLAATNVVPARAPRA
jgi:hypothetical protein